MRLAERVHDAVSAPYDTDDGAKTVGASIGVALARARAAATSSPTSGSTPTRRCTRPRRRAAASASGASPGGWRAGTRRRRRVARRPARTASARDTGPAAPARSTRSRPPAPPRPRASRRRRDHRVRCHPASATATTRATSAAFATSSRGRSPTPASVGHDRVRLGARPDARRIIRTNVTASAAWATPDRQQHGGGDVGDPEGAHGTSIVAHDLTECAARAGRPPVPSARPRLVPYWMVMPMKVGVARETAPGERRVALVPEALGKLTAAGLEVLVEAGAGAGAMIPDQAYTDAGATVVSTGGPVRHERRHPPRPEAVGRRGRAAAQGPDRRRPADAPARPRADADAGPAGVTAVSLDAIPRTLSRAQTMDALSCRRTPAATRPS